MLFRLAAIAISLAAGLLAQKPDNVLVVINQDAAVSRTIGEYYVLKRHVPLANVCRIRTPDDEYIERSVYDKKIAAPLAAYLKDHNLIESILYIVTTSGVPLRISGSGEGMDTQVAAVDSELTLLYEEIHGHLHPLQGMVRNPYFGRADAFRHPNFPIYLVTRLSGYDFADVKGLVDRALRAKNIGKFVLDLKASDNTPGNAWLRDAARQLPPDRVVIDDTSRVVMDERDVIGYASWGSNDPGRKQRTLGFKWLPGAIMTEYVSTNARTFKMPPAEWTLGNWGDQKTWFAGAPQTLTADYIHEGVTGASGHVFEPFLGNTPRPDLLLPAYYRGHTLAESYYRAIPSLSWQNVVIGDPLCRLGNP